jgi:hypothetical protein
MNRIEQDYAAPHGPEVFDQWATGRGYQRRPKTYSANSTAGTSHRPPRRPCTQCGASSPVAHQPVPQPGRQLIERPIGTSGGYTTGSGADMVV